MFRKYRDNRGATAIEYGLIATGIAVAIISGLTMTGTNAKQTFCTIASAVGAGSGNCSGSSSSGSSSNLSGITTASQLSDLNSSLDGKINKNYLSPNLGGPSITHLYPVGYEPSSTNYINRINNNKQEINNLKTNLETLNKSDPITNVFGVVDVNHPTNNNLEDITSYSDLLSSINDENQYINANSVQEGPNESSSVELAVSSQIYGGRNVEVTTASGAIYTVPYNQLGGLQKVN